MLFSAILSICAGFISLVILKKFDNKGRTDTWLEVFRSVAISLVCFVSLLAVSEIIFEPMFKLQTYCESEPDDVIELVDVSESCRKLVSKDYTEVVNILNAGKKFVVTDGEFYYYCRSYKNPDPNSRFRPEKETIIIETVKATDEIQVNESDSPYAGAGVMKIYRCKYSIWWGWFFFDNPRNGKMVFLIPKGTFGKGKIITPELSPIYVPAG